MSTYLILSIVVGLVALGVAVMLSNAISAANAGTARMKEIAGYIHEGAMAFPVSYTHLTLPTILRV